MKIRQLFIFITFAISVLLCQSALAGSQTGVFSTNQEKAIGQLIRSYLIKNPEVLIEASKALQQKEMANMQTNAKKAILTNAQQLLNAPNSPVLGNPKGNVTLIEFYDYQCQHCRNMVAVIAKLIQKNPNLRVVFKDFPIMGNGSKEAALASLAALKQGPKKYMAFHHALMVTPKPITMKSIFRVARRTGLRVKRLARDMKNKNLQASIKDNFRLAQSLGLIGTPAFIITSTDIDRDKIFFIPGAVKQIDLQKMIDKAAN